MRGYLKIIIICTYLIWLQPSQLLLLMFKSVPFLHYTITMFLKIVIFYRLILKYIQVKLCATGYLLYFKLIQSGESV